MASSAEPPVTDPAPPEPGEGGHARRLASGSLAQQVSQITGLLAMFAVVTVLARELSLAAFGVYGLLSSLSGYMLVIQNAAASAAVRNMSTASTQADRDAAFSTAAVLFAATGAATGILVAGVGVILAAAVNLSPEVAHQARVGALLLGLVTAVGWPLTVHRDTLRAHQMFVGAALTEVASLLVYAALMLSLGLGGASLSVLIAASGTIPLFAGLGCWILAAVKRVPYHFHRGSVSRRAAREFAELAGYVSLTEAAATIIYALDRVILGLFKNAATVGLYEGPVRAHNLVRSLNSAVTVTVLPSASRYLAEGDLRRVRLLVVRGFRYTLALVVPLTLTAMILAGPLLDVWLGPEFRQAETAMIILLSYWLFTGALGIATGILVAAGRAKAVARYAWAVALANLAMSVALVSPLGLEGVTIGTAVPYLVGFPYILKLVMAETGVTVADLARECWLPVYATALVVAVPLLALRWGADLASPAPLAACAVGAVIAYWVIFYAFWFRPEERGLVRDVARGALPGRR